MEALVSGNIKMVAKTFFGLEDVLANELQALGATEIVKANRAVYFEGDKKLLYKANICVRTALKILIPIYSFQAQNEHQLYKGIQGVDWSKYFSVNETFAIDSTVSSQFFNHSKYVALKSKDAIVDQFRERVGERPSIHVREPKVRIHVHISQDECTISIDSSGESLHKRGYRKDGHPAPLNEILAAGLILNTGWKKDGNFIDYMCGSGTLVIEAALIAYNIAPNKRREDFGFAKWPTYDQDIFDEIIEEVEEAETDFEYFILGSDFSEQAVEIAKESVKAAKLGGKGKIVIERKNFMEQIPLDGKNLMVLNPPYGERISNDDIDNFYKLMGDKLKKDFLGTDVWIISANADAMKLIGLRPTNKITFFNGSLECKFNHYELFAGGLREQDQPFNKSERTDYKKEQNGGFEKKTYEKKSFDNDRPFEKSFDKGFNRSDDPKEEDKKDWKERNPKRFEEREPGERKAVEFRYENRSPIEKKDRKPFERKDGEPRKFEDRKPFERRDGEPRKFEDRKPFERRDGEPRKFEDRKPFERKDGEPRKFEDRKPFERKDGEPRKFEDRKPFERKDGEPRKFEDRKPFERKDGEFKKYDREEKKDGWKNAPWAKSNEKKEEGDFKKPENEGFKNFDRNEVKKFDRDDKKEWEKKEPRKFADDKNDAPKNFDREEKREAEKKEPAKEQPKEETKAPEKKISGSFWDQLDKKDEKKWGDDF